MSINRTVTNQCQTRCFFGGQGLTDSKLEGTIHINNVKSNSDDYMTFDDCSDNLNVLNDEYDILHNIEGYSGHFATIQDNF